jgi:hypothetical protein
MFVILVIIAGAIIVTEGVKNKTINPEYVGEPSEISDQGAEVLVSLGAIMLILAIFWWFYVMFYAVDKNCYITAF